MMAGGTVRKATPVGSNLLGNKSNKARASFILMNRLRTAWTRRGQEVDRRAVALRAQVLPEHAARVLVRDVPQHERHLRKTSFHFLTLYPDTFVKRFDTSKLAVI